MTKTEIEELTAQLNHHPIYTRVSSVERLRTFMEAHVFAVWDYMSLLKSLQIRLTCVTLPWRPVENNDAARMINEIVLGEETDEISKNRYVSHFALYIEAMREVGADTSKVIHFLECLSQDTVEGALQRAAVAGPAQTFVKQSMKQIELPVHQTTAAFLYGREDLVPQMFRRLLKAITENLRSPCPAFETYLARHIELDESSHGPLGKKLLHALCGDDQQRWNEVYTAGAEAVRSRIQFWDALARAL